MPNAHNKHLHRIEQLIHKTLEDMKSFPSPCVQRERLEQNLEVLQKAKRRFAGKEDPPKAKEPEKVEKKVKPKLKINVKKSKPIEVVESKVVESKVVEPKPVEKPKPVESKVVEPKHVEKTKVKKQRKEKKKKKKKLSPEPVAPLPSPSEPAPSEPAPEKKKEKKRKEKKKKKGLLEEGKLKRTNLGGGDGGPSALPDDLSFLTVVELRRVIQRNRICRGISRMRKAQLIAKIQESEWYRGQK
jgi:hypothetical protein